MHFNALVDSLWLVGWESFQIVASLGPNDHSEGCQHSPRILAHSKQWWGTQGKEGLSAQSIVPILRRGPETWWIYAPMRLDCSGPETLADGTFPPFRIFQIKRQNHRWRLSRVKSPIVPIALSEATVECPAMFGFAMLAQFGDQLWWSDRKQHHVYRLDALGAKLDSVCMRSDHVVSDHTYPYDPSHSMAWNHRQIAATECTYGKLFADPGHLYRLVHIGPESRTECILHSLEDGSNVTLRLPVMCPACEVVDGMLVLPGTRIGDRIAFPYYSIPRLMEEATR